MDSRVYTHGEVAGHITYPFDFDWAPPSRNQLRKSIRMICGLGVSDHKAAVSSDNSIRRLNLKTLA